MPTKDLAGKPRIKEETAESVRSLDAPFRELFENNPQPMWVYDLQSLFILVVNQAAIKQYFYSRSEFLQMTIRDIHPLENVTALLNCVAEPGPRIQRTTKWKHRKKDGTLFDVEVTSHDVYWSGRPARLVVAMDISERLHAEQTLRQRETRFRGFLSHNVEPFEPKGVYWRIHRPP